MKKREGLVQVYTGNGKGKTTAAIGLAIRASGAGLKVYIMQFIKAKIYSEIKALALLDNITVEQCGLGCFIRGKPKKSDLEAAKRGLEKARRRVVSGKFDVIILDEINIALSLGLIRERDAKGLINAKPKYAEMVLTGRYCPKSLIERADLVTEMRELKHPYQRGIKARRGIEF
ncbi:MAG: cob(I)yrinic acid a,c-diamide adenosyltransferase [Candidatus Omnitrophota bacterium]